ncbi:Stk1 family PASTA domain-containing Ser/Thr kinase [Paenibacillus yanchengensis]|uniref:non-specific serine/threonine protein kinase n=1 Tax=Paenibacillus yanchengensis TaxID=2035833 RepID=A0ABW4YMN1_9BACL
MIGHELGGRYEIISRIGGGGMALVYKANDILLNRKVAVKILRQQFVHDEEFITRFRREAQSAAALSHPNVVSIYDVGEEEDTHYIVMEYIEGRNLNEIIKEYAPLQVEEAVDIAIQIGDALDHAHSNHIIHRDIKPHNILVGNNGRVKVTDFGIARAVTSSTITQTGSVIGSVHYFSPEHAKGISTGEKSDLYSLGIVLYQMLTAQLPFLGESPISVALKHLQEDFADPRTINATIPQSVENIIIKAMRKNPDQRYATATEMIADLATCLSPQRRNEPKISFMDDEDAETIVMPVVGKDIKVESRQYRGEEQQLDHTSPTGYTSTDTHMTATKKVSPKEKWKKPLIIVGVTLVLLAILVALFYWVLNKISIPDVEVPYVINKELGEAEKLLEEAKLRIEYPVISEFSTEVPKGFVINQSKKEVRVKEGSLIQLTVSDGPELEGMIDVVGKPYDVALASLEQIGILEKQITAKLVYSDDEAKDTVLEQSIRGGENIDPLQVQLVLTVSNGPKPVDMPDLVGMTLQQARNAIKAVGLVLDEKDILYEASYFVEKDIVLSQDNYQSNEKVVPGSNVVIRVSKGIPAEARSYRFEIKISPAKADQQSEVKISYSDARGEDVDTISRTINSTETIPVTVVLAPDSVARVSITRDRQLIDIRQISYDEAARGNGSEIVTIPGAELPPEPSAEVPPPIEEEEPPVVDEVQASVEDDTNTEQDGDGYE